MRHHRQLFLVIALCLLASVGTARGQSPDSTAGYAQDRLRLQVGPHTYAPLHAAPLPFVRTYLRTSVGLGKALDVHLPVIVIDSVEVLGLEGDLMFATLDFKYEHAVKNWLGVWGSIQILARLGTGVQSLLSEGISAALAFEVGTVFKLYESDRILLSGAAELTNNDATVVNLLDFVQGIIDSGKVTDAHPLVRQTPILTGDLGLRAAWSISELAGIYANGKVGRSESVRAGEPAKWFYDVGAVLDLDLRAVGSIPVGVSTGYVQTNLSLSSARVSEVTRAIVLGINYRNRADYAISVELTWDWLPNIYTGETIQAGSMLLMTQYFF